MAQLSLLRLHEVIARTGLSRSTIYATPDFPKPVPLTRRTVGWSSAEIDEWIQGRIAARTDSTQRAA